MRNRIDIDYVHSRAIVQEIGERLRAYLRDEPELPATLRRQMDRLCELEGQSPLALKRRAAYTPHKNARRGDQWRLSWSWGRKG
jgi:hypothetical protein